MLFYPRLPLYRGKFINFVLKDYIFQKLKIKLTRFAMEIDEVYYIAEVKEKEEAWKKYKAAVERGSAAGV